MYERKCNELEKKMYKKNVYYTTILKLDIAAEANVFCRHHHHVQWDEYIRKHLKIQFGYTYER